MEYAIILLVLTSIVAAGDEYRNYLSNEELYTFLSSIAERYDNISHLYSIGTSSYGEELWVLMLSLAPSHEIGVPNVKVIGNIHGDEPVGRELIISFIKMLLKGYEENDRDIIHLLNTTKIHLMPSANPDGFLRAVEGECKLGPGRRNGNNVDLNRDFPPAFPTNAQELFNPRERETTAIIDWMIEIQFALSISIHSGSLVVAYPFDEINPKTSLKGSSPTDDEDVFQHLALTYAINTKGAMYNTCPNGPHFKDGITNGASWYSVKGTMSDYNYKYHGCMELTVEVSCCKYPHPSQLSEIANNNLEAIMTVLGEVHQGIKGIVTCSGSRVEAYINVLNRNMTIRTTERGEYWRILLPGRYFLEVESANCETATVKVEIPKRKIGSKPIPLIKNIDLRKKLWNESNDEIELIEDEIFQEDEYNVTFPSYSTESVNNFNLSGSANNTLSSLKPRMESSISFSTNQSLPSIFIIILCLQNSFIWTLIQN